MEEMKNEIIDWDWGNSILYNMYKDKPIALLYYSQ